MKQEPVDSLVVAVEFYLHTQNPEYSTRVVLGLEWLVACKES